MSDRELPIVGKPLEGPFESFEHGTRKVEEHEKDRLNDIAAIGRGKLPPQVTEALKEFQEQGQWSLERMFEKAMPDLYRPDLVSLGLSADLYAYIQLFLLCSYIAPDFSGTVMRTVLKTIQEETDKMLEIAFYKEPPAVNTTQ